MKINKSTKGFTIIELLIAMSIALLLSVLLSKVLISTTRIASDSSQQSYSQKSARSALSYLSKEIMDAEGIRKPSSSSTTSDSLFIKGLKKKNKKMIPDVTNKIYKPENDLSVPWIEGKSVVVYVNGISKKSGFTLDYVNKTITFTSANLSSDVITADFSYRLDIEYKLNNGNLVKLSGNDSNNNLIIDPGEVIKSQTIANNLTNASQSPVVNLFTWISSNNYKIELVYADYNVSTVINISSGVLVEDVSNSLPSIGASTQLRSLMFTSANNGWVVGQNGTILQHSSTGWTNKTSSNPQAPLKTLNSVYFINNNYGWAVGEDRTILKYVNTAWSQESADGNLNDFYPKDSDSIYAIGSKGVGASVSYYNGSSPWVNTAYSSYDIFNSISEYNSNTYLAANNGKIYYHNEGPLGSGVDGDVVITGIVNIEDLYEDLNVAGASRGLNHGAGSYNTSTWAVPNFNNITINSGGTLTVSQGNKLYLRVKNILTIKSGGSINASGFASYSGNGGTPADSGNAINLNFKTIALNGSIVSNGHEGGSGNGTDAGNGGIIDIISPSSVVNDGLISAIGGNGSRANSSLDFPAGSGGNGGDITITSASNPYGSVMPIYNGGIGGDGEGSYPAGSPGGAGSFDDFSYIPPSEWLLLNPLPSTTSNLLDSSIVPNSENPANYYLWVVGAAGAIFKYPSSTKVWSASANTQNKTTQDNLNAVHFFDSENGWAVGDNGTILKYNADSNQWFSVPYAPVNSGIFNNLNDIFLYSKDEGFIVGDNKTLLKISNIKGKN